MDKHTVTEKIYSLVAPSHPNEWEVEEVAESLERLPDKYTLGLLEHIPAIWPVSHSLCYEYLQYGAEQVKIVTVRNLAEWVRQILYHYEKSGLRAAAAYMADAKTNFIERQESTSEVSLADVRTSMTHYIRGVAGQFLEVGEDPSVWTDTETIYLPSSIDIFPEREQNRLLYKFLVTYQWVVIQLGVFSIILEQEEKDSIPYSGDAGEWNLLSGIFEKKNTLFLLYLFSVGSCYIKRQFPGLWSRSTPVFVEYLNKQKNQRSAESEISNIGHALLNVFTHIDSDKQVESHSPPRLSARDCSRFISERTHLGGSETTLLQQYLLGKLHAVRAGEVIRERREAEKKAFVTMLARILPVSSVRQESEGKETSADNMSGQKDIDGFIATISESIRNMLASKEQKTLQLKNEHVTVPDELRQLADKIASEFGSIPQGYIQAAAGLAGQGITVGNSAGSEDDLSSTHINGGYVYDEWDCRRNGYRSDWCTVLEEELELHKSNFIPRTLLKYSGLRKKLRAQFELMQTTQRFVRRQRDGDDLDLDAITDAIGDNRAGKSASDRLFVRLLRDERSITTLFLIDMSNSTSGWIGTFIKESLVLLCEAMEKVGDQYGIYGFSGMRRSRCKLYHIKNLDEPYDAATKERISGIVPKDYTRMAPAIRHMVTILEKSDAKSRLLITLSDGKPEDYDGYYGEYAIEDTKKALLEARGKGISPFCITIDKKAQDYLGHMFGSGNYCFINRIESLPVKMAQIYRMLTRG